MHSASAASVGGLTINKALKHANVIIAGNLQAEGRQATVSMVCGKPPSGWDVANNVDKPYASPTAPPAGMLLQ